VVCVPERGGQSGGRENQGGDWGCQSAWVYCDGGESLVREVQSSVGCNGNRKMKGRNGLEGIEYEGDKEEKVVGENGTVKGEGILA
jgi:hypothetical protein